MNPLSVLVVDDEPLIRGGICALLRNAAELPLASLKEAADGEQALLVCAAERPDVVLMDLRMPRVSGIEAIAELSRTQPEIRVLALTTFSTEDLVLEAMAAGASGYLVKDRAGAELVPAIEAVMDDGMPLSPQAARALAGWVRAHGSDARTGGTSPEGPGAGSAVRMPVETLTDRELDCVRYLARGMSNQEIAGTLYVSVGAVKGHLGAACRKWGVRDRVQLLVRATQLGVVVPRLLD